VSIVEKSVRKAGLRLEHDTLPPEQRKVKCFQRLIAAMRACEAEIQDELEEAQRKLNESLENTLHLQDRLHKAEGELIQLRLKDHIDGIAALTVSDKTKLLEFAKTGS
jgi:hypothetical protein